jgi:hypothetical protein
MLDVDDPENKENIMKNMIEEINIKNLKKKIIDIYRYKIGGSDRKLRVYYS